MSTLRYLWLVVDVCDTLKNIYHVSYVTTVCQDERKGSLFPLDNLTLTLFL